MRDALALSPLGGPRPSPPDAGLREWSPGGRSAISRPVTSPPDGALPEAPPRLGRPEEVGEPAAAIVVPLTAETLSEESTPEAGVASRGVGPPGCLVAGAWARPLEGRFRPERRRRRREHSSSHANEREPRRRRTHPPTPVAGPAPLRCRQPLRCRREWCRWSVLRAGGASRCAAVARRATEAWPEAMLQGAQHRQRGCSGLRCRSVVPTSGT